MSGPPQGSGAGGTIVAAGIRVLRKEAADGIAMSFGTLPRRTMVLLELETERGDTGLGESWVNFPAWAAAERVATLRDGVLPLVIGADAEQITLLHQRLVSALEPVGRQWGAPGPVMQAISAVDVALWDLAGQAAGRAISRLAGGRVRDSIPVYASSLGPHGVSEQAARCREAGFGAVKVKLGFGTEHDLGILRQARTVCGPDVAIYADANQGWSVDEAIGFAPALRDHDVRWVEEPVRGNDLTDIERFYERTGLPVATGENVYRRHGFWPYIDSPAVQILQPDISKTGGLSEVFAICQLAAARDKVVIPHLYGGAVAFAATLQLAGCSPQVSAVEYDVRDNPLRDPLLAGPPVPARGVLSIPDGPGLGVHLDRQAMSDVTEAHYRVEASTP
jgi:L-alanine-DL-glutamate epimerase-like enolase superfamily enzyme